MISKARPIAKNEGHGGGGHTDKKVEIQQKQRRLMGVKGDAPRYIPRERFLDPQAPPLQSILYMDLKESVST